MTGTDVDISVSVFLNIFKLTFRKHFNNNSQTNPLYYKDTMMQHKKQNTNNKGEKNNG